MRKNWQYGKQMFRKFCLDCQMSGRKLSCQLPQSGASRAQSQSAAEHDIIMTGYSSPAPVYHSTPAPRPAASCKIYSKFPDPPSSKLKPQPRAVLRVLRPPGVRSLLASAGAHFMLQLPSLYWQRWSRYPSWSSATLITSTIVTSSTINTCQHSPLLHNITVTPHQQRRLGSFLIYCLCLLLSKYNRIRQ